MPRLLALLLVLPLLFGASELPAQSKKGVPAIKVPGPRDPSINVTVFMRDKGKNELLVATRIWPDNPEYNALALERFFATMKALGPGYKQDDEVAYTWANKGKVAKCSIYLESADAGTKTGTGAVVGCEANGVSNTAVPSTKDSRRESSSQDAKHLDDVMELFKKQEERAKASAAK
jgi:hypothetical protein